MPSFDIVSEINQVEVSNGQPVPAHPPEDPDPAFPQRGTTRYLRLARTAAATDVAALATAASYAYVVRASEPCTGVEAE